MNDIQQKILNFDIKSYLILKLKKADPLFWSAFFTSLIALSIVFLYHSTFFMFGDHDWQYLRHNVKLEAGLFEGRFSQFLFINILSLGKILPIINNLLGFTGFSLGIALLAKYWSLPRTKTHYILFALFTTLTPYILSFMYFSFIVIPCLSWNAVIILSLLISSSETSFLLKKTISSALLFMLALGGYPPVINLYATALSTKIFLNLFYDNKSLKNIIKDYKYSIINFLLGAILYKLALLYFTHTGAINESYYNLQIIPLNEWADKFILISKDIFKQFIITLPFITSPYKAFTLIITLCAIYALLSQLINKNKKNKTLSIICFIAIFYSALITLFLSPSIKETEFSPRIDFFGLLYVYSAMLTITLKSTNKILKNISYTCIALCLMVNINSLSNAQKVWNLGFNAELSLYKRIQNRFKSSNRFNPNGKYIIVQGGGPSFRERFYHTPYTHPSDDLLSISYIPGMNSGVMFNYYTYPEFADKTSYVYTFREDIEAKKFLQTAKPWPSENSTMVGNYWIMLILDNQSLNILKQNYLR